MSAYHDIDRTSSLVAESDGSVSRDPGVGAVVHVIA